MAGGAERNLPVQRVRPTQTPCGQAGAGSARRGDGRRGGCAGARTRAVTTGVRHCRSGSGGITRAQRTPAGLRRFDRVLGGDWCRVRSCWWPGARHRQSLLLGNGRTGGAIGRRRYVSGEVRGPGALAPSASKRWRSRCSALPRDRPRHRAPAQIDQVQPDLCWSSTPFRRSPVPRSTGRPAMSGFARWPRRSFRWPSSAGSRR